MLNYLDFQYFKQCSKIFCLSVLQMFLSSNSRPQQPPPPSPPPPPPQCRPSWATCSHDHPVTKETASSLLHLARWNAGIHPGPARPAVPRLSVEALRASQRSHWSTPS